MAKITKSTIFFLSIVFIIAQYFFVLPYANNAHAADYNISYDITYQIDSQGIANVDYHIRLTNQSDLLYAASQSLTTTQTDLTNLSVVSSLGYHLNYQLSTNTNTTTITTSFNSPAIGQGSTDDWDIKYQTKQVSSLIGHSWNLLIPGFGNRAELNISNVAIHVNVPNSFGNIDYSSPRPVTSTTQGATSTYTFSNDQINTSGITMILGDKESYSFSFNYPVNNTGSSTQQFTIAAPPDTAQQRVVFTTIDPKPDSFVINNDNDYVLTYSLLSHKTGTIKVSGYAQVTGTYNALYQKPTVLPHLSTNDVASLTKPTKYWGETDLPYVNALSKTLVKGKTSNVDKAKAIYDYIVKNFKYNKNALVDKNRQRKGAVYALKNPTDVICQEYVDAFVALTRSAGIPAVEDAGYGNTLTPANVLPPDVLHAWAEFYDPTYGWIPVDPTWESTSGANFFGNVGSTHFLLAQYGHDSINPELVLSFVKTDHPNDNIKLGPTNELFQPNLNYQASSTKVISITSGTNDQSHFVVQNNGNEVIYLKQSSLTFTGKTLHGTSTSDAYVFPSMSGNINFSYNTGDFLLNKTIPGKVNALYTSHDSQDKKDQSFDTTITVHPGWFITIIPVFAVIFIFVLSYVIVNIIIKLYKRFTT